jgi:hypothetical protein
VSRGVTRLPQRFTRRCKCGKVWACLGVVRAAKHGPSFQARCGCTSCGCPACWQPPPCTPSEYTRGRHDQTTKGLLQLPAYIMPTGPNGRKPRTEKPLSDRQYPGGGCTLRWSGSDSHWRPTKHQGCWLRSAQPNHPGCFTTLPPRRHQACTSSPAHLCLRHALCYRHNHICLCSHKEDCESSAA